MQSSKSLGDPFVKAILNQIFEVAQIDPACVVPDYKLCADLGLNRIQVQTVLYRAAEDLGYVIPFEACRVEDSSARQLVDLLRHWSCSAVKMAA